MLLRRTQRLECVRVSVIGVVENLDELPICVIVYANFVKHILMSVW